MVDLSITLAGALSTVLVIAGLGKMATWRSTRMAEFAFGGGELSLAAWLLSGLGRPLAACTAFVLFAVYVAYAIVAKGGRCHCFGQGLPATGRAMQRLRNATLFGISGVFLVTVSAASTQSASESPVLAMGVGVISGIAIVAMPWTVDWLLGSLRRPPNAPVAG